ncbi:ComF family protein [Streptomyces monticola]|uniref:ComF family protein n=1 Tax=Streptomyces monticola TaxID=2666263 RepID=A0ABW2JY66_9ACTN
MRGWWRDFADLVLPADCGGCGSPRAVLCGSCRAALCGRAPRLVRPVPEPAGLPVVHAAAPYEDEVRAVLLAHKERGALGLAEALGAALAGAVRAGLPAPPWEPWPSAEPGLTAVAGAPGAGVQGAGPSGAGHRSGAGLTGPCGLPGPVLLVPVPSARRAVAARGHDPARRIALAASRELRRTGVGARVFPVLRQRRRIADQSGLNSRQRLENVTGALDVAAGAGRLLAEHRVVLVDDLMTTGASLAEAARALRAGTAPAESPGGTDTENTRGTVPGPGELRVMTRTNAAVVAASPDSFEINRN